MERIDISQHARDPKYYNKDRDIEVALAWNAIKKILIEESREELFEYIKSVRLTDKNIIITTTKPIANAEITFYKKKILERYNTSSWGFWGIPKISIRLQ